MRVDEVDFTRYDIVFLVGGWGAAYDFGQSAVLGEKITEAWAAGKVIGGSATVPSASCRRRGAIVVPLLRGASSRR